MITSADNSKIRQARTLLSRRGREQHSQCLVEGVRLIEDAMRAGEQPALIFCVPAAHESPRAEALLASAPAAGVPIYEISPAIFATLSDTVSSQGVVAVMPVPALSPVAGADLVLVLDQIRDPGNLGTILRSAEAAGVGQVLLTRGCADPWGPKVLRAGMGAHFRLPLQVDLEWPAIAGLLAGRPLWAADAHGELAYDRVDWTQPAALVIGGETEGISAEASALTRGKIYIPMRGGAESLNAAMAATVVLFEVARQRRHSKGAE
jgi:TrmH family RNA methyltransferase